jgi:hypothetical protein
VLLDEPDPGADVRGGLRRRERAQQRDLGRRAPQDPRERVTARGVPLGDGRVRQPEQVAVRPALALRYFAAW